MGEGSLCTGGFSRDWFLATCESGVWDPSLSRGPAPVWNPTPVALGRGGVATYLGLPEVLLGSAHTQPGWPSRYCSTVIVKKGLGFGCGSAIE